MDALRKHNFRARGSQAHGFSEMAEVENLFIDGVEEYKKEIKKKVSAKLAVSATLNQRKTPKSAKRL